MIELIRSLIEWLHGAIPKRHHVVIYGWPDFEDNSIALEQELQHSDLEEVILLVTGIPRPPMWAIGAKTRLVRKNSLFGLWLFLRADTVFFTHPCFVRQFPDGVASINVWHGMPIKRIGLMLENHEVIRSRNTLATSPFWAHIMEKSMPSDQGVITCGLPRNDRLFSDKTEVLRKVGVTGAQKLVAWLPTYRTSVRGELREDGEEYGNAFELPDIDLKALNEFFKQRNAILLTKPHPMAMHAGPREWSHLKIIHDSWLFGHELSLYETIGACDALITDVSSVVIDYLLLDRPVIHAFPDIELYKSSRGFSVEPIEDYFAGEVVSNQEELLSALEVELAGKDPHAQKRRILQRLSHSNKNDESTARLLKEIGLIRAPSENSPPES